MGSIVRQVSKAGIWCYGISSSHKGDGPYFLFSNAMDTYRSVAHTIEPSAETQRITSRYTQRSQRYQKLILISQNCSVTFSSIALRRVRPEAPILSTFKCSNEKLNRIWLNGARTVDMCTVAKGETAKAWDVTENGTRVYGQHWAPCRQGTRWTDKTVTFQVKVEQGGASWGIHMVANGLIFCLNVEDRTLTAFEGLSDKSAVFPTTPRGSWTLPSNVVSSAWISVEVRAHGSLVHVLINHSQIATVKDLEIHPLLGGADVNSGSVAFGGPAGWIALYRSLLVTDGQGLVLYDNDLLPPNEARTLADFAVGTNKLPCTIDGAKRDRAVFGGDLHTMGRSIYHSTMDLEAAAGSIKLLSSHQTSQGYLGNLCPIQAPVHDGTDEAPTYAFYSLSYALLLVVAIKDYWMHSGNNALVTDTWDRLEKLMGFTEGFTNDQGLVAAPPPLSMTWFPMGGPVFGASGQINLAFYDALKAMAAMSIVYSTRDQYSKRAEVLKQNIVQHLWASKTGILKMSDHSPDDGLSQDTNAYSISLGVSPFHTEDEHILSCQHGRLPLAFSNLDRWDKLKVVSPYATGFAVEACFERNLGHSAIDLVERVWGPMADASHPNYSGGHWETLTEEGKPFHKDTSLMHGWSTWPVHLLPRYLAGVQPVQAGWKRWAVKPVLAGLDSVDVALQTVAGHVKVSMRIQEKTGLGSISITVPVDTEAEVFAPEGWTLDSDMPSQTITGREQSVQINLRRRSTSDMVRVQKSDDQQTSIGGPNAEELKSMSMVVKSVDQTWFSQQFDLLRSTWAWLSKMLLGH